MAADYVELRPFRDSTVIPEKLEQRIKAAFRKWLYGPLLDELGVRITLKNAKSSDSGSTSALKEALERGQVTFSRGVFRGQFGAAISKELRGLGAKWDNSRKVYRLQLADMPYDIRAAIAASETRFVSAMAALDERLRKILPEEIAGKIISADLFDKALWKSDNKIRKSLETITVLPELSPEQRRELAEAWGENLSLEIRNFAESEILDLRRKIQKNVLAGNRYQAMLGTIQRSYGVTASKAKFLASQETRLMLGELKAKRYTKAGVPEYKWNCVKGSPAHPVRPAHKALDGTIQRWDAPPIVSEPGQPERRANAGMDYNCRCGGVPVLRRPAK